jgi:hypothetical protein
MEDTTPTLAKPVLSKEDLDRIKGCDFYLRAKEVIQSAIDYREYEVGSAVFIVRKDTGKLVSSDYEGKNPEKYIIVENDEGFIFVKRIKMDGKPGAAITCVTIDYPSVRYELKVDDGYVEAMLFDTQDQYDPSAEAKDLAKRKNKASRENSKKRLLFDDAAEAYAYVKTLKIGDIVFSTEYSYGGEVTEYTVDSIDVRPAVQSSGSGWTRNRGDEDYTSLGFKEVVEAKLKVKSTTARYQYDRTLSFKGLAKSHSAQYYFFYLTKPVSPEDLAK